MRIGIVAQENGETFGIHADYLHLAESYGTPVIISPIDFREFWSTYGIDGLILPGGSDVNPLRYGFLPSYKAYRPNSFLEYFDTSILPLIIERKLPIFGICRGLQTLNVHFGGTLRQHLRFHPYSKFDDDLVHEILVENFRNKRWKFGVNSFHHQAIDVLGRKLTAVGISKLDKLVEIISHDSLPIVAVQWHPERMFDTFSLEAMKRLFS